MKKTWSRVLATVLVLAMVLCMPGFAASAADTVDYDADHATSAEELTDADLPELLSSDKTPTGFTHTSRYGSSYRILSASYGIWFPFPIRQTP